MWHLYGWTAEVPTPAHSIAALLLVAPVSGSWTLPPSSRLGKAWSLWASHGDSNALLPRDAQVRLHGASITSLSCPATYLGVSRAG